MLTNVFPTESFFCLLKTKRYKKFLAKKNQPENVLTWFHESKNIFLLKAFMN